MASFFVTALIHWCLWAQPTNAQLSSHDSSTSPTEIAPPLETVQLDPASYCLTEKWYTTQPGDTCGSIAKNNSVSAAYLYMSNQNLIKDCSDVKAGIGLCLPMTCKTYELQPTDTCWSIERSFGAFRTLPQYNSWLNSACSNLQSATDFYGKTICVSPQGGTAYKPRSFVVRNAIPDYLDGHSRVRYPAPEGATVAEGTTTACGKWHVVAEDDLCVKICLANYIDTELFHETNPSLDAGDACDASLKVATALCVGPIYGWQDPRFNGSPSHG